MTESNPNSVPPPTLHQRHSIWILITAHPDDESMFFIPTLRSLIENQRTLNTQKPPPNDGNDNHWTQQHSCPEIKLLCLSNGDYRDVADGPIRTKELYDACNVIGIPRSSSDETNDSVTVIDHVLMKDGPNEVWSPDLISKTVLEFILNVVSSSTTIPSRFKKNGGASGKGDESIWKYIEQQKQSKSQNNDLPSVDLNLLTFDEKGVSGHTNHVDVFRGIRFLLNEKCHISPGKSPGDFEAVLKLIQCQSQDSTANEHIENSLDLNVHVYTLKSVSNPLYKYFLWVFVELLPYLFSCFLQLLMNLIYFLFGGSLLRSAPRADNPSKNRKSSVLPRNAFSGMKCTSEGNLECAIVEPILVWKAMAAHNSQFVWYRRLSVIFSRYTYLNNLQILKIDKQFHQEDDETLPPIVITEEGEKSPEFLLSPAQMETLRELVLPINLQLRPWKRVYCLSRDGDSFVSFQKLVGDWNSKSGGHPTLLVVKTTIGDLFGGFSDIPYVKTSSNPVGSGARLCLFRFQNENCAVYGKDRLSSKKIVFDATRRLLAFGGGDGGDDDGFGLCLEDTFARGTTSRCEAFGNAPLVDETGGLFQVIDLEVWGFTFGQL